MAVDLVSQSRSGGGRLRITRQYKGGGKKKKKTMPVDEFDEEDEEDIPPQVKAKKQGQQPNGDGTVIADASGQQYGSMTEFVTS